MQNAKIAHRLPGAAAAVEVNPRTIWRAIKNGSLRSKKCGRARLILDADLRAWAAGLPDGPAGKPEAAAR
jgi:excisionase family DNA binding protein